MDAGGEVEEAGREAEQSDWLDHAVRFGLVAYGVVHLMIAWLALQLAFGDGEGKASGTGALRKLAEQPFGGVLIWAVGAGMILLVIWRALDACVGHRGEDDKDRLRHRIGAGFKAVVYLVLAVSAIRVAAGGGSGGGSEAMTAKVMSKPGGTWLVGAIGLGIIAYGAFYVWRGWSNKHAEHLKQEGRTGEAGRVYLLLGKVGHLAKGFALGLVGVLFLYAAATHDPDKSGGLDAALHELQQQPYGSYALAAVAIGIGCYGLFCFARARHLSR